MEQENNPQNQAPTKSHKIINIAIIVIVLVIIAALIGNGKWKKNTDTAVSNDQTTLPEGCKPGYLFSETTGKPCPAPVEEKKEVVTAPTTKPAPSGFEEAVRLYSGRAIMVDAACATTPATLEVATGTRVLVANNSNKSHTLALGEKKENLTSYHYFTTGLKLPGTYTLTCDGLDKAVITVK